MKKIKAIIKLDVEREHEYEEIMNLIRNYDYKILDKEEYDDGQ